MPGIKPGHVGITKLMEIILTVPQIIPYFLGPVHTTPEIFENGGLVLRLGLPSTLIRHQNGAYRKRSSNRRNLNTLSFRFRVDGNILNTNGAFRKRWRHDNHIISLTEFSSKHKSKMVGYYCVFKFLRRSVDGKHLMRSSSPSASVWTGPNQVGVFFPDHRYQFPSQGVNL